MTDDVLGEVAREVARQDRLHPGGYPNDRDGVRLGLASVADELEEALAEWHVEKKSDGEKWNWSCGCVVYDGIVESGCGYGVGHHDGDSWCWHKTRAELLQAVAVGVRLLRSLTVVAVPSVPEVAADLEPVEWRDLRVGDEFELSVFSRQEGFVRERRRVVAVRGDTLTLTGDPDRPGVEYGWEPLKDTTQRNLLRKTYEVPEPA